PAPGSGARAGEQRPHARRGASPRGLERRYPARLQRRLPPRRAGAAAAPDREGPRERPPSHLRRPRAAPRRAEGGAGRVSVVGIVLANDRSRPLEFWFKLDELSRVQLDELVAVDVFNPFNPDRPVTVYAVVDDLIDSVEGLAFPGDTELLEQGASYGRRILMAHARVLRFVPDVLRPPRPGAPVRLALGDDLAKALYVDRMRDSALPVGVLRNGQPAYLNYDFLCGVAGGHVNISGVSGVATK